jgi:uncharacterized RDD family membrane protein YckC
MAEDQPGRPGSGSHDQPGQGPTEPLGGPPPPPAAPAAGPPREALAGFWRRFASAFLDWILIGILAAAIGELFGVEPSTPPASDGGVNIQYVATGPFILVELAYFTYFHATSAGQSIGNKILGIRVLDAETGRSLPYVRAFVPALVSNLSALVLFLGFFWMLWEPRKRTWHDIVADSLVVSAAAYPPGEFGRPAR